jgi:hypothetical protein
MSTERFRAIAVAYADLPSGRAGDPQAERSYAVFRDDVIHLYRSVAARVEPWAGAGQPYRGSAAMFADLDRNGRLLVYTGGDDHPFLARAENVMFRAVHDYFGPYLGRFSFGPRGELGAWKPHCRQFAADALPAMTAETLGQNCWVNYGPFAHLPPAERPYAEQKAGLLPELLWRPLLEMPESPAMGGAP